MKSKEVIKRETDTYSFAAKKRGENHKLLQKFD